MYRLQLSLVPTNHWQEQSDSDYFPLPLPVPLLPNPFIVMQANPIPWCEGFYGSPFCARRSRPQEMPVPGVPHWQQQHQHHDQAPSPGPSRTRRTRRANQQRGAFQRWGLHMQTIYAHHLERSEATVPTTRRENGLARYENPSKNLLMTDHKT